MKGETEHFPKNPFGDRKQVIVHVLESGLLMWWRYVMYQRRYTLVGQITLQLVPLRASDNIQMPDMFLGMQGM